MFQKVDFILFRALVLTGFPVFSMGSVRYIGLPPAAVALLTGISLLAMVAADCWLFAANWLACLPRFLPSCLARCSRYAFAVACRLWFRRCDVINPITVCACFIVV